MKFLKKQKLLLLLAGACFFTSVLCVPPFRPRSAFAAAVPSEREPFILPVKERFYTQWTETTRHLAMPHPTFSDLLKKISMYLMPFQGFFQAGDAYFTRFARRTILPAAAIMPRKKYVDTTRQFESFWFGPILSEQQSKIRQNFTPERHEVVTPDGVVLSAILFRHRDGDETTPVVIRFNGNYSLSVQTPVWLLDQSNQLGRPHHFVTFDYREVGDSQGTFHSIKDLIVDGSSIVQWVNKKVGTPLYQIHFYGISLGGAVALETQGLDPEHLTGRSLNDRSFASFSKMAHVILGSTRFTTPIADVLATRGFACDAADAFRKIKGAKLVVYHPHDRVIPYTASLHQEIQAEHDHALCLEPEDGYEAMSAQYHHAAPLEWHKEAVDRMGRFLLEP